MWSDESCVVLNLSKQEALELFSRCLRSHEDDNEDFRAVLRKLARAIDSMPPTRPAIERSA